MDVASQGSGWIVCHACPKTRRTHSERCPHCGAGRLVKCPSCAEMIQAEATKCRFCGEVRSKPEPETNHIPAVPPAAQTGSPTAKVTRGVWIVSSCACGIAAALVVAFYLLANAPSLLMAGLWLGGGALGLGIVMWSRAGDAPSKIAAALVAVAAPVGVLVEVHTVSSLNEAKEKEIERIKKEAFAARAREAEEKEAKRKADIAAIQPLRKTNPDEFLMRLKELDLYLWTVEAKMLRPKLYADHERELDMQRQAREVARQRDSLKDYIRVDFSWRKGGFDNVMLADFVVKSSAALAVRDIGLRCTYEGNSGTMLGVITHTIYDVVPAKGTKKFSGVNLGLINLQAARASCDVVSAQPG